MNNKYSFFSLLLVLAAFASCAQKGDNKPTAAHEKLNEKQLSKYNVATFAAGCFWHEEALFESIKGVKEAVSGYAGGTTQNPTYESIEEGNTGHAETVNVYYDSSQISYATLLKIYFAGQDPTQVNGQGPDHGTQYRSIAFYRNTREKTMIETYMKTLAASGKYKRSLAVQTMPFTKFWTGEEYHQNFIERNPTQGYVQAVSIPEIKHLQKEFPELVKPGMMY